MVSLGLPLKVATIILGCIFSILSSDFTAHGPISISMPSIEALTEFFHADVVANIHPMPVSWYLISLPWIYLCSWKHIISMLWSITDALNTRSCPILFKFLTLNVAICFVRLHFSNFCFNLGSLADFRTLRSGLQPQQDAPLFIYPHEEQYGLYRWFECGSW